MARAQALGRKRAGCRNSLAHNSQQTPHVLSQLESILPTRLGDQFARMKPFWAATENTLRIHSFGSLTPAYGCFLVDPAEPWLPSSFSSANDATLDAGVTAKAYTYSNE